MAPRLRVVLTSCAELERLGHTIRGDVRRHHIEKGGGTGSTPLPYLENRARLHRFPICPG
jgi:hypothetical protein